MAKTRKEQVFQWPSQNPDLKPIEMLWHNRKRAVHKRLSANVSKLKRCCKEEWAKIPP